MDYGLSITKISHLFWLGRYAARVDATLRYLIGWYDTMLDGKPIDYQGFCRSLDIPCPYTNPHNFMRRYIFDKKNPDSIRSAAEFMLGNGMVLRENIGSNTLSYLQMAVYAMDNASVSVNPGLGFQRVCDLMMAFTGSCDVYIDHLGIRNMIKCGSMVERISLYLSFGYPDEQLRKAVDELILYTDHLSLLVSMDLNALSILQIQKHLLDQGRGITISRYDMKHADESLFQL
ncbi:MAG: alpha-E domain-containing protein [Selenomonadaceae bacterium]|nr:alpha-E domain-containing protein [Selenomonadaceae bacterium]MBQ1510802.1 alpha-E domain-containing protein [Selenomonadaceae bacterium]MBQ3972069.1 alpha-E domain-containing protein [Selenomonadaceae bacterium]